MVPPVLDLGRQPYEPVWRRMLEMRRDRKRGVLPDTLLLLEHEPVITVGVQGDGGEPLPEGVPVYHVERGGRATYHGPGQLVGYPIVDLTPRGRDVRRYVRDLEELVIRAISPLGLSGVRVPGKRGVWIDAERKIASIGIAVEEWVAFHGFALNVDLDLRAFDRFHPCGFEGRIMTSVAKELGRPVSIEEVKPGLLAAWKEIFETPA